MTLLLVRELVWSCIGMGNSNLRVVTSAPVETPAARILLAGVVCGADISIRNIIWDFVLLRINAMQCFVRLVIAYLAID